jgi:hypothetical protein
MRLDLYHHQAGAHYLEDILSEIEEQRGKLDRLTRAMEAVLIDLTALKVELARLVAYAQTPKPEDPASQAAVDTVTAELKAVNDALTPPVTP